MKQFTRYGILAVTLLFIAMTVFLVNCKKSALDLTAAESTGLGGGLVSSCGDTLKANTVLGLIRNDHDPVDDKITLIQYHYAQAIRELAKNPTYLCYMVAAMQADSNGVSTLDLSSGNSAFAAALNAQLRGSVNANPAIYPKGTEQPEQDIETVSANSSWEANNYLKSKLVNVSFTYHPTLYFIKKPVSCIPQEGHPVTVVIAQDVDDCDDVAGWRGDEETILSERDASSTTDIIIFVGPGKPASSGSNASFLANNTEQPLVSLVEATDRGAMNMTDVRINDGFRYEASGKSEFNAFFRLAATPPNSDPLGVLAFGCAFNPFKISKGDIGNSKLFTGLTSLAFAALPQPVATRNYFCVAYEHDWWASRKTITDSCEPSPNTDFNLRMKYSSETYHIVCGSQPGFWSGGVFTLSSLNNKGFFKMTGT